uniref:Putative sodium-coupled neutral amino acid transporter 10 n=1 Tax=Lygus hesperus TaxID=30085 RepID=A0A0A9W9T9_LYGHE
MGTHMGHVFTLANSIIGVSVLAMPFCFKQCGIILSILMLLLSSQISRLACHYLMKSAIIERMKNFEMLAFRTFGPTGKLIVELCIIGFMLGTCVAFFVVIGDLGPNILGPVLGLEHPSALRPSVLIGTAIFVVLPLGLLRNVDSLNGICAASLAFYGVLVLKVFFESSTNLFHPSVWGKVYYWRPSGLLRCIPIFSMALSCQTQLFEIFGSLPTTPLDRANAVVKSAVNLTTFFYIAVGFFGYVAYANTFLTGNVMMNFSDGASSDIIKICFLLSVAVSFPLVIFPCRASIYSFLYSKIQHSYEGFGSSHIPETRFQCITLVIVTSSLVIGLMIPNIELVLGLVGSTLGVFICVITPGVIFTTVSFKRNNERLLAQILVGAGLVIMVLGTYANLYATEEALTAPLDVPQKPLKGLPKPKDLPLQQNFPNPKEVERVDDALKKLKEEELRREKETSKDSVLSRDPEKKEDVLKNVSPGAFSDHNPQPEKADEGPKPQPIAPEPPEEPLKKIPINIPESLKHLEAPKKDEETTKRNLSPGYLFLRGLRI